MRTLKLLEIHFGFISKISTPKTRFRECGSLYRVYSPVTTSSLDKEENMKK